MRVLNLRECQIYVLSEGGPDASGPTVSIRLSATHLSSIEAGDSIHIGRRSGRTLGPARLPSQPSLAAHAAAVLAGAGGSGYVLS